MHSQDKPDKPSGHFAIIGGTGLETLPDDIFGDTVSVRTPEGAFQVTSVSDNYVEPSKLYFVPRHGAGHRIAPHLLPVRQMVDALTELGVSAAYGTNAVGALRVDWRVGDLVVPSDFLDFTRGRVSTVFGPGSAWQHTDFSEPYSGSLRTALLAAAKRGEIPVHTSGTYACFDGPRYETPAEIRMAAQLGGDVVGMTGVPEAIMLRESGIQYASLCVVTNHGAGLVEPTLSHRDVAAVSGQYMHRMIDLLLDAIHALAAERL